MAMNFYDLFKFSKTISWSDGEIKLMDTFVSIVPTTLLAEIQKNLVTSLGIKKAYDLVYESSKSGAYKWNDDFIKAHNFTDKRKIVDWQWKIVTFAGWGKWQIINIDLEQKRLNAKFESSPLAKYYGKSKYPVDIIATGFSAGGISAAFGEDLDCIETNCIAMGNQFCEIEIGRKEYIAKRKEKLWKNWGLM